MSSTAFPPLGQPGPEFIIPTALGEPLRISAEVIEGRRFVLFEGSMFCQGVEEFNDDQIDAMVHALMSAKAHNMAQDAIPEMVATDQVA